MPGKTILEIPSQIQEQMLKELRHSRFNYFLGLHILLLCACARTPTEIGAFLFCSRSTIYRTVRAYRDGKFVPGGLAIEEIGNPVHRYIPSLQRSLLAIVKCLPFKFGWCRTRWSCSALSIELNVRRGIKISEETVRRWLHDLGYVWKRARHVAKDCDPLRIIKLARIRYIIEHLRPSEVLLFVDELGIHLLPKIGYDWMPRGTQTEVMTPGQNQKRYLAAALDHRSGKVEHVTGDRKTRFLFLDLLRKLDTRFSKARKIYLVADNYRIHKAKDVVEWLAGHPRFEILWLPSYCPKANPIERAFGDIHDKCTRNHKRSRIDELLSDVTWHLKKNGPWRYRLSTIYYSPEVDAEVANIETSQRRMAA